MGRLIDGLFMPKFYLVASVSLILSAVFIFVVFFAEIVGDVLWKATTSKRPGVRK
jgi:hypothetical protein